MTEATQKMGRIGLWDRAFWSDDPSRQSRVREFAVLAEQLGFGAVWLGVSPTPAAAGPALSATERLVVVTGITNVWVTGAADSARQTAELVAAHPGRFVLGLGIGHPQATAEYRRPYATMVEYLDELDSASPPVPSGERILAALGPKMLRLAAERSAGAHPYMVPLEHIKVAREILGAGPLLAPEINVVLDHNPDTARRAAREHIQLYLGLTNYTANFRRFGFTDDDFADGGSDRLIDALYLWGDPDRIRARVAEFYTAGADHLAIQPVPTAAGEPVEQRYRALAATLLDPST